MLSKNVCTVGLWLPQRNRATSGDHLRCQKQTVFEIAVGNSILRSGVLLMAGGIAKHGRNKKDDSADLETLTAFVSRGGGGGEDGIKTNS